MALNIIWTKSAQENFEKIVTNIKDNWTEREVQNFVNEVFHFLELLKSHPQLLEKSQIQKNVFRGPINALTILTYQFKPYKKQIVILTFRSSRKKPLKK